MLTERIAFVFLTVVFGLYVIVTNDIGTRLDVNWLMNGKEETRNATVLSSSNMSSTSANATDEIPNDAFDTCLLKVYDPYYKGMKKVLRFKNPLKDCNKNFHPPTELIDGKVRMHPLRAKEFDSCAASCLYYVTSKKTKEGDWWNFTKGDSVRMDCDFIWTKCFKKGEVVDQGVHMQIKEVEEEEEGELLSTTSSQDSSVTPDTRTPVSDTAADANITAKAKTPTSEATSTTTTTPTTTAKATTKPPPKSSKSKEEQRQPNVYIIIVDSVASTQALRSIPKTVDFLKKNMSGVFFHHLNKIGDNSRPNGYAFTMGKRIINMDRSVVGAPNLKAEYDWDTVCHKYRDNDSVIMKDYQRAGFKTLYAEDYPAGTVYTWPACWGFEKQPSTHCIRPYTAITAREKLLKSNYESKNCFEPSRESLRYTGMFMKAYKDKPKFGFTWMATISHDDANLLFHEDDYFENFFKENEPHLRNSFVFFMGDHGMRWGSTYKTELGKRELKNPFLIVTVPEFLRSNDKFMGTLEENSMKLLTQFDMHATFVDLLKFAPKSNFKDFNFTTIFEDNPNNATSILRPLGPFGRRSCRNIPVPFQYCLCEYDMVPINKPDLADSAHKFLTEEINQILTDNNITGNCSHLTADRMINFQAFAPEYPNRLYEIEFSVMPGQGEFKALIHYDESRKKFKIKGEIERLNAYGTTAKCMNHLPVLKSYCYCLAQTA